MTSNAQIRQGTRNLMKSVFKRKVKKARRIITYFYYPPSIRKQHLYSDEMLMNEQDVDDYIESLKNAKVDEESVAHVLLKWLQLKKKYADVTADKSAELDMEAFKRHAKTDD